MAGAEGLEPSARGFGVDVGKCVREQGRAGGTRFPPQVAERVVLVWCYAEKSGSRERRETHKKRFGQLLDYIISRETVRRAGHFAVGRLYPLAVSGGPFWG